MSACEVIDQIKHLSPTERVQVVHYVVENAAPVSAGKAADGLPVIRADAGIITSRHVRVQVHRFNQRSISRIFGG